MDTSRPSPIAGTWYPGDRQALSDAVDAYMNAAELPELPGELLALIAPHAGYVYSGPVAGYAFAALRNISRRVSLAIVVSPMHQPYRQPLLTSAHPAYQTPLGKVPVDQAAVAELDSALTSQLGYGLTRVTADQEHSLEIELPFLQRALPEPFTLLPVMIRARDPQAAQALGNALAAIARQHETILVASTDLSHFYDQITANQLDTAMLRCFGSLDPQDIFTTESSGRGQACGHAAVAAVLWAAKALGANTVRILRYATSGDVTGDTSSVVGYGAAAVIRDQTH